MRVLRELALHGGELTTTLLARRTGVTDQSVRNVLRVLGRADLLRVYGQGRAAAYQLDASHPVAAMLIQLFRAEDQRISALYDRIARAARQLDPPPLAVWVFGSVARGEDRAGSDLDLLLVVDEDGAAERAADTFREELAGVEREHRVTISVVPVSGTDVLRLARTDDPFWREMLSDAVVLHGRRPESLLSRLESRQRPAPPADAHDG
ncbi:MAG TPA: nucleotidyltransferase domain-containing protein [Longimicrobiaceae bacterium]|nr:nucleotidyltransferase domain-containing protein [Longimicrobiaceae bacterium]